MLTRPLLALLCLGLLADAAFVSARSAPAESQSDLDAFMEKVLARRDDNWKKLQQYVLEEKEAFDLTGPGRFPLWGMRREYTWFIRDGIFVRSPLTADGVKLSESDRRKAETDWLRRQKNREENDKRERYDYFARWHVHWHANFSDPPESARGRASRQKFLGSEPGRSCHLAE